MPDLCCRSSRSGQQAFVQWHFIMCWLLLGRYVLLDRGTWFAMAYGGLHVVSGAQHPRAAIIHQTAFGLASTSSGRILAAAPGTALIVCAASIGLVQHSPSRLQRPPAPLRCLAFSFNCCMTVQGCVPLVSTGTGKGLLPLVLTSLSMLHLVIPRHVVVEQGRGTCCSRVQVPLKMHLALSKNHSK